jgi:hypothetical protein
LPSGKLPAPNAPLLFFVADGVQVDIALFVVPLGIPRTIPSTTAGFTRFGRPATIPSIKFPDFDSPVAFVALLVLSRCLEVFCISILEIKIFYF